MRPVKRRISESYSRRDSDLREKIQSPIARKPKTLLQKDFLAMQKVWRMLQEGTIKWIGEIGRQY